ncbi:MAG: hypothetical protein EOP49_32135, partial [Sphingobacteriales bacterium]
MLLGNEFKLMNLKLKLLSLLLLGNSYLAKAQHEMHMSAQKDTLKSKADTTIKSTDHSMHNMNTVTPMSHAYSLNLPMSRNGSGTSWLPDAAPMYGLMLHSKKWMYMLHGNVA